jgi:DNA-binding NarL/FixJ family response regulator
MLTIMMTPKRILVADDSDTSRGVLAKYYLATQRDLDVCGEAVNGEDAIEKARKLKPDLVLLDVAMPGTNGIVVASVLKEMMPGIRIILFTMYTEALARAFPCGGLAVDAVISKGDGMQNWQTAFNPCCILRPASGKTSKARRECSRVFGGVDPQRRIDLHNEVDLE